MKLETLVLVVLVLALGLAGCAADVGHGSVYGSRYPAGERAGETAARGLSVYGLTYPRGEGVDQRDQEVSAPGPQRRGLTVYGFEYPRS